jgi:hypothetical protein
VILAPSDHGGFPLADQPDYRLRSERRRATDSSFSAEKASNLRTFMSPMLDDTIVVENAKLS